MKKKLEGCRNRFRTLAYRFVPKGEGVKLSIIGPEIRRSARRPKQRTRISDVAESLGLTKGTVSRALNGYPDISQETRLRVQKRAEALGYSPLSHAQAIRTGYVKSLGLVLQVNEHDSHRPFLAGFLAGVTKAATSEGWTLTVATAESDEDMLHTLARLVDERKVDGFILPRTFVDDPRVKFLRSEGVPFVLFGRTGDTEGCAWYDILGERAMEAAVKRLHGFGHTRIAFVNGGSQYYYSTLRLRGYLSGMRNAGLVVDKAVIRSGVDTVEQGAAAANLLLTSPQPTCCSRRRSRLRRFYIRWTWPPWAFTEQPNCLGSPLDQMFLSWPMTGCRKVRSPTRL